jgi:hypothetical protein
MTRFWFSFLFSFPLIEEGKGNYCRNHDDHRNNAEYEKREREQMNEILNEFKDGFNGYKIRILFAASKLGDDPELLFVAIDIAQLFFYENPREAVQNHVRNEYKCRVKEVVGRRDILRLDVKNKIVSSNI